VPDKSKPLTLAERLNATGNKLAELSKKVSESTKTAVGNANESIKSAISENKQKRDAKRQKKLEDAREELSKEGLLDDVPSMVTLPEFENERMSIVSEQNDNLVLVLEEMQRLSERVDSLEKRNRLLHKSKENNIAESNEDEENDVNEQNISKKSTNQFTLKSNISRTISFSGITLLIGLFLFFMTMKFEDSTAEFLGIPSMTFLWFVSMFTWVLFTTKTIDNQTPVFNISYILHVIFAFSSGLGLAIVFEVTNGDLMSMGVIALFVSSVSFTCVFALGFMGPMQRKSVVD